MKDLVVAVVPARGGSRRLTRKNLHPLRGAPVIAYTIHAALAAKSLDAVLVSSEDAEILGVGRAWGAEVIERPLALAEDGAPIDDTLRHALETFRATRGSAPDILVWLQADVPIREAGTIDRAVAMLADDPEASSVATGFRVWQHPAWMKTVDPDGYLRRLQPDVDVYRFQDLPPRFLLDGAVVALRTASLGGCGQPGGLHRYLGERPRLLLQEHPRYSLNIETVEHIELAEFYLARYPEHRLPA